ncbi:hypothetical protein BpHYR1_008538 [Brachionus plicatilis]|uniref:Uncharacterized protein n=1 Tax=Brachionus plicatilis TaxID=10195 RepID=A0A3M7T4Z2_BRAPC|nr:hypothetical protein BpHYR1_008538 [Brachionus plicatilis]
MILFLFCFFLFSLFRIRELISTKSKERSTEVQEKFSNSLFGFSEMYSELIIVNLMKYIDTDFDNNYMGEILLKKQIFEKLIFCTLVALFLIKKFCIFKF